LKFQPIRAYYWPWQPCWISDWNEKQLFCRGPISSFFSETTGPIGTKLSRNVPWMVLYKITVFRSSRIFNMAARANNMLWLELITHTTNFCCHIKTNVFAIFDHFYK
jgi:hypothetical protein